MRPLTPPSKREALLNSELLDLWYAVRGKIPRDVWRNYEPKRMNEMPYRPTADDPRAEEVAELLREIAANRRALLPQWAVVPGLAATVKDPWRTGPVDIDERALIAELSAADTVSLRLDPGLAVEIDEPAQAKIARAHARTIELRRGRKAVGRIVGEPGRLDLLERVLDGKADESVGDTLLPKDAVSFAERIEARRQVVQGLLDEGRRLVEARRAARLCDLRRARRPHRPGRRACRPP